MKVLWPHEIFAALWKFHPGAFAHYILGGDPKNIREFWKVMPPREGMRDRADWAIKCIPIALHGDGVSITNIRGVASKTIDCISWSSVLGKGKTRLTTFFVFFAFTHLTKKTGIATTWGSFWAKLCKSLRALWLGLWPAETMEGKAEEKAGQPLAAGFWGVVYVNRGDLEWMASHFRFARGTSRHPCSLCKCTNIGRGQDLFPWTDSNYPPSWMPTCLTDEVREALRNETLDLRSESGKWTSLNTSLKGLRSGGTLSF